jgi:hypothetical protein
MFNTNRRTYPRSDYNKINISSVANIFPSVVGDQEIAGNNLTGGRVLEETVIKITVTIGQISANQSE